MTISQKLRLGLLTTAALASVAAVVGALGFGQVTKSFAQIRSSTLPEIRQTNRAAQAAVVIRDQAERALEATENGSFKEISGDVNARLNDAVDQIGQAVRALHAEAAQRKASTLTNQYISEIDRLDAMHQGCRAELRNMMATLSQPGAVDGNHRAVHAGYLSAQRMLEQVLRLQHEASEDIESSFAMGLSRVGDYAILNLIVGGAAVVITAAIGLLISRPIAARLAHLRQQTEQLGKGNLAARAEVGGDDEIGQVARAFNDMAANLGETRDRLVNAAHAADAANRTKSAFLANMSHEIRTPMTAIVGYSDFMLQPDQTLSDRHDCLQVIRRNATHLLELLNDILDLSKIEADKMTVERIDMELVTMVCDVASMLRPRALDKGLSFRVTFQDPIPRTIKTDALRFKQILMNVVGNAIKFTSKGEVTIHVASEPATDGRNAKARILITDTGIGMTPEQIAHLFQPFAQADESMTRRFGGAGLGLTISKRLLALLGGTISVQSTVGTGSTFIVEFDAGDLQNTEMLKGVTESIFCTAEPAKPRVIEKLSGKVLFVEDGPDNQRLISAHLRKVGLDVTLAGNGQEAVDLITSQTFDVVLMDMQMPVLDGYAATSLLRRRGFQLPIIALTAHALPGDREKCLNAGCTDYLTKPIGRDTLLDALTSYLGGNGRASAPSRLPGAGSGPAEKTEGNSKMHKSEFANDPDMKELVEEYVHRLPEQVALLTSLLDQGETENLRRVAHQLKGSGGGYGFPQITALAAVADASIKQGADMERVRSEIAQLVAYIRQVSGYNKNLETSNATEAAAH